jgi:hypothetical protein
MSQKILSSDLRPGMLVDFVGSEPLALVIAVQSRLRRSYYDVTILYANGQIETQPSYLNHYYYVEALS